MGLDVKIKLSTIGFLFFLDGWFEEFINVIPNGQRVSKYSHDLNNWTTDLMFMFNDINEAICDDVDMELNTDGICTLAPKGLDSKIMLDSFEEQFNLPFVFTKELKFICLEIEVIHIVCKRSLRIRSTANNASEGNGTVVAVLASRESDRLVTKDIVPSHKQIFASLNPIVRMDLLSDNEESACLFNGKEHGQVKVFAVRDIVGKLLIFSPVHRVDIMHLCRCNSVKYRCFDGKSIFCPFEDGESLANGCGIIGIESSVNFKPFGDSSLLNLADQIESILFINSVIMEGIGLRDDASVWCGGSEAEIVRTFGMSLDYVHEILKTGTARKLRKDKRTKMIPMRKTPFLYPVVVSADNTIEQTSESVDNLVKGKQPRMHNCSNMKLDTMARISKVGYYFQSLLCCA